MSQWLLRDSEKQEQEEEVKQDTCVQLPARLMRSGRGLTLASHACQPSSRRLLSTISPRHLSLRLSFFRLR